MSPNQLDPHKTLPPPDANSTSQNTTPIYSGCAKPVAPGQPAAANVARQQAEQAYQHNPPNQLQQNQQPTNNPYYRTHQPTLDWQLYHSAWQKYYQQYYHRHYMQQMLAQRAQQTSPQPATATNDTPPQAKSRFRQLRNDLLAKVGERAKKLRRSNHFVPILSAVIIGLIFLFLQYNRLIAAQIEAHIGHGNTISASDASVIDPAANVGSEPKLIIPKINVSVPVAYNVNTTDERVVQKALNSGAAHYKLPGASSLPGQAGNTVILGHSSNDIFDPGNYKFVFVSLSRLEAGDLFYASYLGKRYVYKVTHKKVVKPTDWRILQQNSGKPTMVLVTCTPVGTAQSRLLVYGEQISPDPATASPAPANKEDANPATIPGNSPTFFERLWDIFF
jgi:sortase A